MKCEASQEFVVGGFTDPQGARVGLGALLVGYFEGDDFVFAGKVGTGFDTKLLLDLARGSMRSRSRNRRSQRPIGLPRMRAHWVRPGDRRAGCLHRVDRAREAAPSRAAGHPQRQGGPRRREGATVITHPEKVLFPDDGITKGRTCGVLRGDRADHAAAHPRAAGHDGAISIAASARRVSSRRTCRRGSRLAGARRGAEEGRHVHHPLVSDARSLLGSPTRTASRRTCGRRAHRIVSPGHLRFRSRSIGR